MKNEPSQFISKDGIKLSIQTWTINEPVAELILIHGGSEYTGKYNWVAKILNENKINVYRSIAAHVYNGFNPASQKPVGV